MTKFIVLRPDAQVVELEKKFSVNFKLDQTLSLLHLKGVIENKGKGKIERIHSWDICNSEHIHLYGWKKGTNDPSQHSLPSPLDNMRLYGDILCFLTGAEDKLCNLTEDIYLEFFQNSHWIEQGGGDDDEDAEANDMGETEDADVTVPIPIVVGELEYEAEYV